MGKKETIAAMNTSIKMRNRIQKWLNKGIDDENINLKTYKEDGMEVHDTGLVLYNGEDKYWIEIEYVPSIDPFGLEISRMHKRGESIRGLTKDMWDKEKGTWKESVILPKTKK